MPDNNITPPFRIAESSPKPVNSFQTNHAAMSLATLNDVFFAAAKRNLDRAMLHRQHGKWLPISSSRLPPQRRPNRARVAGMGHPPGRPHRHP